VSRIDLSNEYLRAAVTYNLGYRDLKALARNALQYSFLPGESLWQRYDRLEIAEACAGTLPPSPAPSSTCAAFLASSERAREQWRLEAELAAFEALDWTP